MLELGYALDTFGNYNIILLCNDKISKKVPSMLGGFEITYYNSDDGYDYFMNIVDKILNNLINYNKILENTTDERANFFKEKISPYFIQKSFRIFG
jgi:hypothetical protein